MNKELAERLPETPPTFRWHVYEYDAGTSGLWLKIALQKPVSKKNFWGKVTGSYKTVVEEVVIPKYAKTYGGQVGQIVHEAHECLSKYAASKGLEGSDYPGDYYVN